MRADDISFTFEVTNTGDVTLTNITLDDPTTGPVSCPVTSLAPTESTTCSATYTVTQADVDATQVTNTATATGLDPASNPTTDTDTAVVPGAANPSIDLDKTTTAAGPFRTNEVIDYELIVTNTGNQTLTGLSVDDPLLNPVNCPASTLAPGASTTCTGSYTVTQSDADAGSVTNTATAQATNPGGGTEEDTDTEVSPASRNPALSVDKQQPTGSLAIGETITYPFVITNTGDVTLTNIRIDDPLIGTVTCLATVLAPGEVTTCSGDYTVTQADVDAGEIVNTATANADTQAGSATNSDTEITAIAQNPSVTVAKTGSASPVVLGEQVQYEFVVENTGDVTLAPIVVDDPLTGPVSCPVTSLAPGASTTCTAAYTVTQPDVDAGEIINTASVTGSTPQGQQVSGQGGDVTAVEQTSAINLDKDAPFGTLQAGQQIRYEFVVTNSGTVTLDDIVIDDPLIDSIVCAATVLAPGESTMCSGDYTVTQADVDDGEVINVARVVSANPNGDPTADEDSETTVFDSRPGLKLNKFAPSGDLTAGSTLTWTFEVTNTGVVTLTDIRVDDPTTGPVTCSATTLAPGQSTQCSTTSTLTQADIDRGEIVNVATAYGTDPDAEEVQSQDEVVVAIPGQPALTIDKSAGVARAGLGDQVIFTIVVTNSGTVTLTNVIVTDPLAPVTCPKLTLAVGESMTCTAVMTITQTMVDAGTTTNTATARGVSGVGNPQDSSDSAVLITAPGARLGFTKFAPAQALRAGIRVEYTFLVTNTGTVPVTDIVITDALTDPVTCPRTTLQPGESMTCSAFYLVTDADAAAGRVVNRATVEGFGPDGEQATGSDEVESTVSQTRVLAPPQGPEPAALPDPPSEQVDSPDTATPPLAQTGAPSKLAIAGAVTLLAVGGGTIVTSRRRRADQFHTAKG